MRRVVVFGATSAIASGTARCFARQGAELVLVARNVQRSEMLAQELLLLGAAEVHRLGFEAERLETLPDTLAAVEAVLPTWDGVLIAHGAMPDQAGTEQDAEQLLRSLAVNGTSAVLLAQQVALKLERQGHGTLAVIGSGAGVRGRRSTYTYGAAKAMLAVYCEGLRARLHRSGIPVLTVLPCFVDSPMTAYLPRYLRWIQPDRAGARIHRAMLAGKDHVHIPRVWALALWLTRNLPSGLLKRSRSEERFAAKLAAAHAAAEASQSSGDGKTKHEGGSN